MPNMPDAVVLCGGAGLRLRSITADAPKSMAQIGGRPFLELLLRQLRRHGLERVILAVGYRQENIRSHFGGRAFGLRLQYSAELSPLGTGGALRNVAAAVTSESILVMNGDSYTDADLNALLRAHEATQADVSVVVIPADERSDCGSVQVDASGNLLQFDEKLRCHNTRYINAGIYALSRHLLNSVPAGIQISLEKELFPRWIQDGACVQAFVHQGICVDIGTPDRYRAAQRALANAEREVAAPAGGVMTCE